MISKDPKKRAQGPLNLDAMCGVIGENGQPCFRSITCKMHTVAMKRTVTGRSMPYDKMVVEYQKQATIAKGFKGLFA